MSKKTATPIDMNQLREDLKNLSEQKKKNFVRKERKTHTLVKYLRNNADKMFPTEYLSEVLNMKTSSVHNVIWRYEEFIEKHREADGVYYSYKA